MADWVGEWSDVWSFVGHLRSAHTAHGSTVRHVHVAHSTDDTPRVTTHNGMATTKSEGKQAEGGGG